MGGFLVEICIYHQDTLYDTRSFKHASFPNFVRTSIINCSRQLVPSELKQVSAVEISANKIYGKLAIV